MISYPYAIGHNGRHWQSEQARLDLEDVRMPQLALLRVQGFVKTASDQVLNADQARILVFAVVDDTLAHVFVQYRAIVMRFHRFSRVIERRMGGMQVGANVFDGVEVLEHRGTGMKDVLSDRRGLAFGFVCGWNRVHLEISLPMWYRRSSVPYEAVG